MDSLELLRKRYFDLASEQLRLRCDGPKESELNCRAVATLLKAVCCFLQLSRGLKLGIRYFEKYC